MEDIDAGLAQGREELFQFPGRPRQSRGIVLLFPLGPAQDDREIRAHRRPHRGDDFHRKAAAVFQRAAVLVLALVGALPEKLVDQVTVGAVNFHRIEAQAPGIRRTLRESLHHVGDILPAHDVAVDLARHVHARGRIAIDLPLRRGAGAAHAAAVPQLGRYFAALGVHRGHHLGPTRQALLTVEVRYIGVAAGGDMIDAGTLGDNQPHPPGGAAPIVFQHLVPGNIAG